MKYIAPITALVITMTALTLAIIGKNSMIGYDIARKNQQKYYSSHSDEIQTKLKLLLEAGRLCNSVQHGLCGRLFNKG